MAKKKLLILGGTQFVGRSLVELLTTMPQYDVTLFNRGKSNMDLFPDVKRIIGNRETEDYLKIATQNWDCIIDFSAYYPLTFQKLLNSVNGKVKKYIFISTISVFNIGESKGAVISEDYPTTDCPEPMLTSPLPDGYGQKKAEMERILLQQKGMDIVMLRPSFIYGRYDVTDRLYYWLYQAVHNTDILMPLHDEYLSLTYAGDLVRTILTNIDESAKEQVYLTISQQQTTLQQIVRTAGEILGRKLNIIPISDEQLAKYELPFTVMPLHQPLSFQVSGDRYWNEFKLKPTDLTDAIRATLAYGNEIGWPVPKVGLGADKQKEIIALLE